MGCRPEGCKNPAAFSWNATTLGGILNFKECGTGVSPVF